MKRETGVLRDRAQQQVMRPERDRRFGHGMTEAESAAAGHHRVQQLASARAELGGAGTRAGVGERAAGLRPRRRSN